MSKIKIIASYSSSINSPLNSIKAKKTNEEFCSYLHIEEFIYGLCHLKSELQIYIRRKLSDKDAIHSFKYNSTKSEYLFGMLYRDNDYDILVIEYNKAIYLIYYDRLAKYSDVEYMVIEIKSKELNSYISKYKTVYKTVEYEMTDKLLKALNNLGFQNE